jgi:hypothetical protein
MGMMRDKGHGGVALLGRMAVVLAIAVAVSAAGAVADAHAGRHGKLEFATTKAALRLAGTGLHGKLTWHGGPVMHSSTTYTIFWSPPSHTLLPDYESTVNQFLTDVAADSGGDGNVYSAAPQYSDDASRAVYASTFGGATEDTTPIGDNCSKQYGVSYKVDGCVLDTDVQAAVQRALAAHSGWTTGMSSVFFVFLPPGVGECADTVSKTCAYRSYCAYHSFFSADGQTILYAVLPYPDTTSVGPIGICDTGEQPNGNWGDEAVNLVSHEHNEAMTDPLLNAWFDSNGNEDGDKCAWGYGNPLGGATATAPDGQHGGAWNQVINGDHYYLQREWSNQDNGCVQRLGDGLPVPFVNSVSPGSGPAGTLVTISGTHIGEATAVKFNGTKSTFTVVDDGTITATVPPTATTGLITVVTPLGNVKSPSDFTVSPAPVDFTLSLSPGPDTISIGQSVVYTVTLTRAPGFTGSVTLSTTVAPDGEVVPVANLSPRTMLADVTTATLTVKAKRGTTPSDYTVTVTGTKGDVTRSVSTSFTVPAATNTKNS